MVVFTCHGCNETLKKAQVEKHRFRCRRAHSLCCVDCLKDFHGDEFQAHTKCISEDQKYGGQNYVAKENKGEVKQQRWFDTVQQAIDVVSTTNDSKLKQFLDRLRGYPNIPQKEAKFRNFVANCVKERDTTLVGRAWAAIASAAAELKKKDAEKAAKSQKTVENISKQHDKSEERIELPGIETNAEVKPKKHKKHKKEKLEETNDNVAQVEISHNNGPKKQAPEAEPKISCDDAETNCDVKPKKNKKRKKDKMEESEQISESNALPDVDACNAKLDAQSNLVEDSHVEIDIQQPKKLKKHKHKLQENVENPQAVDNVVPNGICNGDNILESETNVQNDNNGDNSEGKRKKHNKHNKQTDDEKNASQPTQDEISLKETCDESLTSGRLDHCENGSVAAEDAEVKPKKHKKQKKHRIEENWLVIFLFVIFCLSMVK